MPTVSGFASTNAAVTTGWTNPTNAYADDGTYATATIAAKNTVVSSRFGGFGVAGSIPGGASINSVTIEAQYKVSTSSSIARLGLQAQSPSGTNRGTQTLDTAEPLADAVVTQVVPFATFGWTAADLADGTLFAVIEANQGNNATSCTYSLDYVKVTVDYTVSNPVLALDLDADALTGLTDAQAVSSFTDQSGQGNTVTQPTGAQQPTYETNESPSGKPTVRFATDDQLRKGSAGTNTATQAFTFFAVVRPNTLTSVAAMLLIGDSTGGRLWYLNASGLQILSKANVSDATAGTAARSTGVIYILALTYDGATGALNYYKTDGSGDGSSTYGPVGFTDADPGIWVGGHPDNVLGEPLNADLFELKSWNYVLTTTERNNEFAALTAKWLNPTLAGMGVAQGQSAQNVVLGSGAIPLAGLNVAQAQATADPTLTQVHVLAGLGVAQAQSAPSVTLGIPSPPMPRFELLKSTASSSLGSGDVLLGVATPPGTTLAGMGVAQAQATADPTLTQVHVLAGLNVAQAQSAASVLLTPGLLGLGVAQTQKVGQGVKPSPLSLEGAWISYVVDSEISDRLNAAAASLTPTPWPTLKTGDVVVLYVSGGTTGPSTISATAPGGAAYDVADVVSGTTLRLARLSRVIASDGEAAPTIAFSPNSNATVAGHAVRGASSTSPIDTADTTAQAGSVASINSPSITPITTGAWSIVGFGHRAAAVPYANLTPGTGYTERMETQSTSTGAGSSTSISTRNANPVSSGAAIGGETFAQDTGAAGRVAIIHTVIRPTVPAANLVGLGVAQGQSTQNVVLSLAGALVGLGVAQAQATADPTLTQVHVLDGLNVAQAQATADPTLGFGILGLGVAQAQATADPTLTQVHVLAGLNVAQPQAGQVVSLGGALQGLGVAQTQSAVLTGLTQVHVLAGLNVAQAQATADPTLGFGLLGLGVAQAQAMAALTLGVGLLGLGVAQAQATVDPVLGFGILGLGIAQAQSAQNVVLTQVHVLAGLGVAQANGIPNILVNSSTNLVNLGVAQAQATADPTLTQVHVLSGMNVAQPHAGVGPLFVYILQGMNVAQAQATADPTLVQNSSIVGMNVAQGQAATIIALIQQHVLAGLGVAHPQSAPNVGISAAGSLSGLNVAQAQATADPVLERMFNLLGLGVAQAQATADPTLGFGLLGLGVSQPTTATMLVLIQIHVLAGMGASQAQMVTAILLGVGALPLIRISGGRVIERYGDGRILRPAEGRVIPRGS